MIDSGIGLHDVELSKGRTSKNASVARTRTSEQVLHLREEKTKSNVGKQGLRWVIVKRESRAAQWSLLPFSCPTSLKLCSPLLRANSAGKKKRLVLHGDATVLVTWTDVTATTGQGGKNNFSSYSVHFCNVDYGAVGRIREDYGTQLTTNDVCYQCSLAGCPP